MKIDTLLSVITPCYNRGNMLHNCFTSLQSQTDHRFEWIIVDDGSTDNTSQVVEDFKRLDPHMPICYVRKENGGKHTALNASHPYIHGSYVLILDSDDRLTPDAVASAIEGWNRYVDHSEIGVVIFLRGHSVDDPLCFAADENTPVDIMAYQRIRVHSSDAAEIVRSDVFKAFPFPVFPGERFLSEGSLWWRISFQYKCVYINKVIYLCDYLEGGLTKSGRPLRIRNPLGGMDNSNLKMAKKNKFRVRIKNGLLYTAYGFFAKIGIKQMCANSDHKALMWACLPLGWLLYLHWSKKYLS